jgi:hypothetical protein
MIMMKVVFKIKNRSPFGFLGVQACPRTFFERPGIPERLMARKDKDRQAATSM